MNQPRRVSPRIPYDEAICLTRLDGDGRYYVQTCDLGATGMLVVSAEPCPVGTDVQFSLLLPGGPRKVGGRIVRVSANPAGHGLALAFLSIEPSVTVAIERMIAEHARTAGPAVSSSDDAPAQLGAADEEPASTDALPQRAADVAPGTAPENARSAVDATEDWAPPPSKLPPPLGKELPSVLVARAVERAPRPAAERPPRRKLPGTAEVPRRPLADWPLTPAMAAAPLARATARIELRRRSGWRLGTPVSWSYLLMLVPAALAIVALLR